MLWCLQCWGLKLGLADARILCHWATASAFPSVLLAVPAWAAPSVLLSDEMILFLLVCVYWCYCVCYKKDCSHWFLCVSFKVGYNAVIQLCYSICLAFGQWDHLKLLWLWFVSVTHETIPCCKIFPCCFILAQALERAISKESLFFHMKVVGRQGVGHGS